jgi:DNA-binding protein Fis
MLRELCEDDDSKIRLAAWSNLIRYDPKAAREGLTNEDRAVRRLSASELIDSGKFTEEDVQIIASDSSSAVRRALIKRLSDNLGEGPYPELPENLLDEVAGSVEDASREISTSTSSALQTPWIRDFLRSSMPEVVTILTAGFRESSWVENSDIVDSVVEIVSDPLLERILRRGKGKYVEAACMKGIMDQKRSEATRSRLVLDRIGRSPSSDFIELLDSVNAPAESELAMAISALVGEAVRSDSGE